MIHRPAALVFNQAPAFFPPGAPLVNWEVVADTNHAYEIEASGRLIRVDRPDGSRWATKELTGSFSITYVPRQTLDIHMYVLFIVCGVVKYMEPVSLREPTPLTSLDWAWVLDDLVVDHQSVHTSKTYRGCLEIIQAAEADPGFKSGDMKVDAMVGMALCRPALLKSASPRNALEYLEDYQLRAVSSWHRAHLNH
ncbi:hypothetical protein ACI77O_12965 [Pseudomonas tritici]|uniref:hypothetical protein n=1 Tax=Pseudomonas tritici TaxID=2745518 RepID=UPI00387ACD29